jgi:hypothetical protein
LVETKFGGFLYVLPKYLRKLQNGRLHRAVEQVELFQSLNAALYLAAHDKPFYGFFCAPPWSDSRAVSEVLLCFWREDTMAWPERGGIGFFVIGTLLWLLFGGNDPAPFITILFRAMIVGAFLGMLFWISFRVFDFSFRAFDFMAGGLERRRARKSTGV